MNESIHKYFRVGALQWMSFPDKASLVEPAPYAAKFGAEMRMTHNNFGLLVDLSHIPVTHPIRKILAPAIIQTVPAVISKISLLTPYFMFPFFCIKRFTAPFC